MTVYVGFDPSAESLHLGNLMGIVALKWFKRYGHTPVALIGGATGMIGDPSGKSLERNLLDNESIHKNIAGIERILHKILDVNGDESTRFLNNYDWFSHFSFINFLRDIGKHFRISSMLAKESVKLRMTSEEGLSFTEFSYQLLQGYDFLHLFDHHGVTLQMGGSDQWGNITAGCELVRKLRSETVFGLTFPLLTRSDGKKFGKSEEGAIWLSDKMLSPYDFYQYLFRMPDSDVIKMMRLLTFMDLEEIEVIEKEMKTSSYHPNSAQKRLAQEITRLVHGEEGVQYAESMTLASAPGEKTSLDIKSLELIYSEAPTPPLSFHDVVDHEIAELFVYSGLSTSKGEARRLIQGGGAYLNNEKIAEPHHKIKSEELIENRYLLLSVGKKKKRVIQIIFP